MAIVKIISNGKNMAAARKIMSYILDVKKTEPDLCGTLGDMDAGILTPKSAYREFQRVRSLFGKDSGRTYTHGTVSWASGEVTHEEAAAFAKDYLPQIYPEHQVIFAVHTDTDHSIPHNPLMVVLKITAAKTTKLLTANFFAGENLVKCNMTPKCCTEIQHLGAILCFTNKFFVAAGAGDGNFSLPPGHPHHLTALGAVKVAVVPVLQPIDYLQKLPVFLIPLVGVPGQGAEDGPDHQPVAQHHQQKIYRRVAENDGQQAYRQTYAQDYHIQFVRAIAPCHKPPQKRGKPRGELPQPAANAIHRNHPVKKYSRLPHIILQNRRNATFGRESLRIV